MIAAKLEIAGEKADAAQVALVVVTYRRPEYLARLLDTVSRMPSRPGNVIVVDNGGDRPTAEVIESAAASILSLIHHRMPTNVGGAGGFAAGVARALAEGAEWVWLMDDDVEILPDGLDGLLGWTDRFHCLHGRRYDADGEPFFWQQRFNQWLALPLPILGNPFAATGFFLTNCGCFEGMLVHRDIVVQIGLPDPRFFLTWDDAIYGWLASHITQVACVDHFVLKRVRPQRTISLGIRHLSDASDLSRYYAMRNRGLVAAYFRNRNRYHPVGFALGSLLTFLKEMVRLVVVERSIRGTRILLQGWAEGRQLIDEEPASAIAATPRR